MPLILKRTLRFFLILLIIGLSLGAIGGAMWLGDWVHQKTYVEKEIPDYDPTKPIPAEALREDFAIIRGAIEENHGDPYIYTSEEELSAMFDAAYAKLDKPMSEIEFVKLVGPIIHAIHDGHTNLSRPDDIEDYFSEENVRFFPLVSYFEEDRVLVWNDGTPEGSVPRGSELLAVDGEPVERFVKRATDLFVLRDGYTFDAVRSILNYRSYRFLTYPSYLKGFPETYEVTFRTPQGDKKTVQIKGVNADHLSNVINARYPDPPGEEVADDVEEAGTRLHWEGDIPVLTIDSFSDSTFDEYAEIVESAFTEIHERGAHNLIIDLREDGGGEASWGWLLLKYFGKDNVPVSTSSEARSMQSRYVKYTEEPWSDRVFNYLYQQFFMKRDKERELWTERDFSLTTTLNTGNFPFLSWPEITSPPFEGHTFLLVSGWTFSAASNFAAVARTYLKPMTVVGQETSGAASSLVGSQFLSLILPNTRLEIRVPLVKINLVGAGGLEPGRGVLPDVEVWPNL